ncbi:MAG: TetR/AcrR family transcriptional regulator [Myxococcales bacterium]|nr:TetR/AcrR family transcriptional regulator [Myxococcales bacterium]
MHYYLRMGRPRDFDLDAALDVAVELFWRQGYEATSVRALADAMGIRLGSFYAAFESKEACFRRALGRYLAQQGLPATPSTDAVRAWLKAIVDPKRQPKGCLLVVSAGEHPSLAPESQAAVTNRVRGMQDFFAACLAGRPSAREDAALLAAAVVGIHVMARAGVGPTELKRAARRALDAVGLG